MQLQPQPAVQNYSLTDLRLMHHISSISRDMQIRGTSSFVIWTNQIPTYVRSSLVSALDADVGAIEISMG